jgi:dipeptidase E
MSSHVLLISNSTLYGSGYLDHAEAEIRSFLGTVGRVLFVPFALYDRDAYTTLARGRFEKMGYGLDSIHTATDTQQAVMMRRQFSLAAETRFDS